MEMVETWSQLQTGAAWCPLADRAWLGLKGSDRLAFLHSFCTQDIKALQPGDVREAFVLNEKGKVLAWMLVLATGDELRLTCAGAGAVEPLIAHLDRYLIREDVELRNESDRWCSWFLCGAAVRGTLETQAVELPAAGQAISLDADLPGAWLAAAELAGAGFLLMAPRDQQAAAEAWLGKLSLPKITPEQLEAWRIESGTPAQGVDVDESNLPQELERDARAISFEKGCYLGQETVARLDAMGRTNWVWVRVRSEDAPLAPGQKLEQDGKVLLRITSAVADPQGGGWIGLGYARRGHHAPGTRLGSALIRDAV